MGIERRYVLRCDWCLQTIQHDNGRPFVIRPDALEYAREYDWLQLYKLWFCCKTCLDEWTDDVANKARIAREKAAL